MTRKYYCYVDETGQDTKGEFFLVSVVLIEAKLRESLKRRLLELEDRSGKKSFKWNGSRFEVRVDYLEGLLEINELYHCLRFRYFKDSLDYSYLTACAIARTLQGVTGESKVTVLIQGLLKKKEQLIIPQFLRRSKIRFSKIRGLKRDDCFVRLADSLAGFLRDYIEEQSYTEAIYESLKKKGLIIE